MAEGLAMQERFAAEPVYERTGRGFLKSEGVVELQRIRAAEDRAGVSTGEEEKAFREFCGSLTR